jgi:hypothetical protein
VNEEREVKMAVYHGKGDGRPILFATIVDAFTGELMVNATLDYCLQVIIERNYRVMR